MRLIDADAMVQRLEERLKELDKEGVYMNGVFDILIDHLMLGSEIRTLREWINKQPTIDVRSIIEHERDIWKTRANVYTMCADTGTPDVIPRFHDAMSKWEVLSDLIFKIDTYEIEGDEK